MREKFKRLTDEVWALTHKFEPNKLENSVVEAKLQKILYKIHDIDGTLNEIIPQLESQVREKQTEIKKLKKSLKAFEENLKQANQKKKQGKNRMIHQQTFIKSKFEECHCSEMKNQEQKFKYKIEKVYEQLAIKKQQNIKIQERNSILQEKCYDLTREVQSQSEVIEKLLAQFEEKQFSCDQTERGPDSSHMMREDDDDSELRKQSDDIETDDQIEEMVVYQSDQESANKNDEMKAAECSQRYSEQEPSLDKVECEEKSEKKEEKKEQNLTNKGLSWRKHAYWFLF